MELPISRDSGVDIAANLCPPPSCISHLISLPFTKLVRSLIRRAGRDSIANWPSTPAPMPSLVYITRVRPLSPELVHALESSGLHVKSFGPGEITADECILMMTPEAALAGVQKAGLAPVAVDQGINATESATALPLQHIGEHLGAEAAIWNFIKAAGTGESDAAAMTPVSGEQPSRRPVVTAPANLGFVASQSGSRVVAASRQKAATTRVESTALRMAPEGDNSSSLPGLPLPPAERVIVEADSPARSSRKVGFLAGIRWWGGLWSKRFWQPEVVASTLLIFAVVLLVVRSARLPSTADVAAVDNSNQAHRPSSDAGGLTARRSPLRSPSQPTSRLELSAETSAVAAEGPRRESDQDFVAEDYTTHFDQQGHRRATLQVPDLRHAAHNRRIPTRIVVD